VALRDHPVERRMASGDGYVFGGENAARRMAERGADAMREAGIEPLAIHDARHTYASLMITAGVNAKALLEFIGHGSIKITLDLCPDARLPRRGRRAARRLPSAVH
jgi:integrase